MPFDDPELDDLANARDDARYVREHMRAQLDDCFERLTALREKHQGRVDRLRSDGDTLYQQMGDAFSRSKECFSDGDHSGAATWSSRGHVLQARLREVNDEKTSLIAAMKAAHAEFQEAHDYHGHARAAHEAAKAKFTARLNYLKQMAAARTEAKAKRRAREAGWERLGETRRFKEWAVLQAKRVLQFRAEDVVIKVRDGYDRDYATYVTDVVIAHRDKSIKRHLHIVLDEDGTELAHDYHDDSRPDSA